MKSPAPILNLTIKRSVAVVLADEVEILLAERRAAWADHLDDYEQKLSTMDPLRLYHACLNTLRQRFQHFPTEMDNLTQKFHHFLLVESQAMQQMQPLPVGSDSIEDIL